MNPTMKRQLEKRQNEDGYSLNTAHVLAVVDCVQNGIKPFENDAEIGKLPIGLTEKAAIREILKSEKVVKHVKDTM